MTMHHDDHPSDERVSAYAGGDSDATTDAFLGTHVAECARCTALVDDLRVLRAALAELPDLVPSRPLQLLPPVPASSPSSSARFAWLRRLTAPAFATGAGLVLIGALGMSGIFDGTFMAASGGAPSTENAQASDRGTTDSAYSGGAEASPGASSEPAFQPGTPETPQASAEGNPGPPADDGDRKFGGLTLAGSAPWLLVLVAGVVLLLAGVAVRYAIQPRAG